MNHDPAKPEPGAATGLAALKVLVVDDDPFQLEAAAEHLRALGIQDITLAPGGAQALQHLSGARTGQPFGLMLCDLHMPRMDGFEFMAAAAKGGFSGALIIVSGQQSEVLKSASLVAQLRRFRFLGALTKPLDKAALAGLIAGLG
jgi:CheY-like chemotaxis protein